MTARQYDSTKGQSHCIPVNMHIYKLFGVGHHSFELLDLVSASVALGDNSTVELLQN